MRSPGLNGLRAILAFSILSTAAHYSHNFVEMDSYPGGGPAVQIAIILSWPPLTAIGLYGYRLYARGRDRDAHACLLIYSLTGLITPAHFLYGSPDIPPFWYATIVTDFLAGAAIAAFVVWSASRPAPRPLPPSSPVR
ncbi:MAG TPA: hypothetical protein VER75_01350 [Thermoleophilaceae bacterium]|nr:hypothetical protein [Thermoleophilaceae bacterium]